MFEALIAGISLSPMAASAIAVICAGGLILIAGATWPRVRETTLTGPWIWAMLAAGAMGGVEGLIAAGVLQDGLDAWRFAAAVGVFTPWMSLLGAKRPQDAAWHFIVASLWGVQALPAAEALFLRPGQPLAIIDFRAYFLMALIGLTFLIHLPTRYWWAGILVATAQAILLWSYLPFAGTVTPGSQVAFALLLFVAAAVIAWLIKKRPPAAASFDQLWGDFRDAFGALWGARVMERVNAAAHLYQWPIRLTWSGFHATDDPMCAAEIPPEIAEELRRVMVNLLRRFASDAWIDARLAQSLNPSSVERR